MLATLSIYVFRIEEERHFQLTDVGHAVSRHQILTGLYHKIIHTLFSVLQRRQLAFLYTPLSLSGTSSLRECYTCICWIKLLFICLLNTRPLRMLFGGKCPKWIQELQYEERCDQEANLCLNGFSNARLFHLCAI